METQENMKPFNKHAGNNTLFILETPMIPPIKIKPLHSNFQNDGSRKQYFLV
jgi:hypothetical protein